MTLETITARLAVPLPLTRAISPAMQLFCSALSDVGSQSACIDLLGTGGGSHRDRHRG